MSSPWGKGPQLDEVSHSRHCILFEHLRYYAYSIVNREREKGSFSTFTRLLEAYAHNRNSFQKLGFSGDLPLSSLRATVKSVARWTWDRYRGDSRCHRGVMQLDKDLPLVERQRLAAARTHEVRQKATESRFGLPAASSSRRAKPSLKPLLRVWRASLDRQSRPTSMS
ncbi:primase C-terminal domain-containing protein [Klebsiella quasipneumoniae]|uniref:primase C-terminal domain-containing protein n=1 Tax=Klebsiella quasipneumoniae TaxID=1463165 RepID=UPI00387AE08E